MATYEELMDAARRADQADDAPAARRFLELAAQARQPKPTGADEMRARGLSTNPADTAEMNAQALGDMNPTSAAGQLRSGLAEGVGTALGVPASIFRQGYNLGNRATAGRESVDTIEGPIPGGIEANKEVLREIGLIGADPNTAGQRITRRVGQDVGAGGVFGPAMGIKTMGGMALNAVADTTSGLAGGLTSEATDDPIANIVAPLAGGMAPLGIANSISKTSQTKRIIDAVPGRPEVKAASQALYDAGEATGKTAARGYTTQLSDAMTDIAKKEGLISPTGRMSSSYSKLSDALAMVKDYAGQKMTPEQMRQVRRSIQGAAQSTDGNEARIGSKMLKQFDKFVAPLVPEFKQADQLWRQQAIAKELEEAANVAGTRRSKIGLALNNEFGNLARKEIRGDMTYPPEVVEAVEKVMRSGDLGLLAPNRLQGALGTVGGGGVGAMLGGPVGAVAGAGGTAGAGLLAQRLAGRLAKGDARAAIATALNGAPLPKAQTPEAIRAAIAALLATTATGPQ